MGQSGQPASSPLSTIPGAARAPPSSSPSRPSGAGRPPRASSSRRSMVGTSEAWVIPPSSARARNSPGSNSLRSTSRAPVRAARTTSATPPTCAGERLASQRSSGPRSRRRAAARWQARWFASVRRTPRGRPDVPEVATTVWSASGSRPGTSSAAGRSRRATARPPPSPLPSPSAPSPAPAGPLPAPARSAAASSASTGSGRPRRTSSPAARSTRAARPSVAPEQSSARGRTRRTKSSSSGSVHSGCRGTRAAPARGTPWSASTAAAPRGRSAATRSPGRTPAPASRRAASSAAASSSA